MRPGGRPLRPWYAQGRVRPELPPGLGAGMQGPAPRGLRRSSRAPSARPISLSLRYPTALPRSLPSAPADVPQTHFIEPTVAPPFRLTPLLLQLGSPAAYYSCGLPASVNWYTWRLTAALGHRNRSAMLLQPFTPTHQAASSAKQRRTGRVGQDMNPSAWRLRTAGLLQLVLLRLSPPSLLKQGRGPGGRGGRRQSSLNFFCCFV